jgi:phytoene dehydrogenase-like protein
MDDYLILGSGISALSFGALMANSGKKVRVLEAHEYPGGYGHTFPQAGGKYKFNAQFHYVWGCGEGQLVNRVLKKVGLNIPFVKLEPNGFDRMRIPGYSLSIPANYETLIERLSNTFPENRNDIRKFFKTVQTISSGLGYLTQKSTIYSVERWSSAFSALSFYGATLQDAFNHFHLPLPAQSLIASQWHDFLLPPETLSFYAWLLLFDGYMNGAYYPEHHFESVINGLVDVILKNGGTIEYNKEVVNINVNQKEVIEVTAQNTNDPLERTVYRAKEYICNMDPKKTASMIGLKYFSKDLQKKLSYEYSPSNFMIYAVVSGVDLKQLGFGKWNNFHSCDLDLNKAFNKMYYGFDYSSPSFALCTPTLMTEDHTGCPEDRYIVEILTVANYNYFKRLKITNTKKYNEVKNTVMNSLLDVVEKEYIPKFRELAPFHVTGSPTTSERFCWSPEGHSYGSNLTPKNMGMGRLNYITSLKNMFFCNASSGFAGFYGGFWTGSRLYSYITGEEI